MNNFYNLIEKYFPEINFYGEDYAGEYGYEGFDVIGNLLDTGDDTLNLDEANDEDIIKFLIKNHFTYGPARECIDIEKLNNLIDPYLNFNELKECTTLIKKTGKEIIEEEYNLGMYKNIIFDLSKTYIIYRQLGGAKTIFYIS